MPLPPPITWDEDVHTLRRPGLGEVFATLVNVGWNVRARKDGFLPRCPCHCEPRPVPSARNRPSPVCPDKRSDFAIVLRVSQSYIDKHL